MGIELFQAPPAADGSRAAQILITLDKQGRMQVSGSGNITGAELVFALQLLTRDVCNRATQTGTGVVGLNPKRF